MSEQKRYRFRVVGDGVKENTIKKFLDELNEKKQINAWINKAICEKFERDMLLLECQSDLVSTMVQRHNEQQLNVSESNPPSPAIAGQNKVVSIAGKQEKSGNKVHVPQNRVSNSGMLDDAEGDFSHDCDVGLSTEYDIDGDIMLEVDDAVASLL